jgi:hypothetical protein
VTVTKNLESVPPWILRYKNAVNSDAFTIDGIDIPPRMARIVAPRIGGVQVENGVAFREVSVDINLKDPEFDPLGWILELLDHGYAYFDPQTQRFVNNCDGLGQVRPQPVPLDGQGNIVQNPQDPRGPRFYRRYRVFKEISYGPIAALL